MDLAAEWLEAAAQGEFACGTVGGERTRRYHALLLVATHPPGGRIVLVNGIEAWVTTPNGNHPITSQRYMPDVVYPDGWVRKPSDHIAALYAGRRLSGWMGLYDSLFA